MSLTSSALSRTAIFAVVGVILSMYALYVEHKVAHKPPEEEFTALCDIEKIGASCSNVFQLPEGRMLTYFGIVPQGSILDVPNAALGVVYYTFWLTLMPFFPKPLTFLVSSLAMASSVFLAIQLLILNELCVLCWSTHIINSRLWWCAMSMMKGATDSGNTKAKEKVIKRV
mmetsp:Transcript_19564/g.34401  ORF Transcript_19564/g.34401 Transcript_19564/m.34401 type:complete len:171 (+) Transcript_19564:36-548(+)